jgi:hypothetical protein
MGSKLASADRRLVGAAVFLASFVGLAVPSFATGPTYDITPVTTSLTSDLTANIPVILAVVGALIALAIGVRMVRKFVKA